MRKRLVGLLLICTLGLAFGCGNKDLAPQSPIKQDIGELIQGQEQITEEQTTNVQENDTVVTEEKDDTAVTNEETSGETTENLTFADLSKWDYTFASGAGGWSEEFKIEKDGFFYGMFHDSEMGSIGEGYPNGSIYYSNYTGHFGDLTKINDYTYEMRLLDITYTREPGEEEISDEMKYIYTESYCLGGNDTFKVYLPGASRSELSEDVNFWINMANQDEEKLTMMVIVDEKNEYGIFSSPRMSAYEEADLNFFSYQASWNYYIEQLTVAETTAEMGENARREYEVSDECMNYLWRIIKYNVSEEKFQEILENQREWLKKRDENADLAAKEFEGGSFEGVAYTSSKATDTVERCEYLLRFIQENTVR